MEIKINEINPSKSLLPEIVGKINESVINGEADPIKLATQLDFVIKACTDAKAELKEVVLTNLSLDPQRKDYYGYKVEVSETGVQYDYTNCNDTEYLEISANIEGLKEQLKTRETFLKSIKDSLDVIQDGEAKTIYPPVKRSSTSPKFTLK